LKKLLIMLVLTVCTAGLFAQMAKYDRKSISITKMNVSPDAKAFATQADVNQIYSELYKRLKGMERFDYNEIPAGITDVNELMKIVKEYTATKIEERAAKQWNIKNEYYGSNFVTGENVDKIMNGAFIMVPTLNSYIITEGKDKEGKQTFTAVMNVKLDVYEGVKNGDAFEAKLSNTVSANGTNASLGIDVSSLLNLPTGKAKDPRKEAIESATNTMLLFLDKEVRKLPMFTIKAFTTAVNPAKDEINFNMGKNVGVKLDDAYQVGFYQGEKFVETGFMKVRKIEQEGSRSQLLIVSNPKGEKESELFNEFDQVIEYPQVGLNIIVGGGMSGFKRFDDLNITGQTILENNLYNSSTGEVDMYKLSQYINKELKDNTQTFGSAINLTAEYNIAKFTNISELYLNASGDFLLGDFGTLSFEGSSTKIDAFKIESTTGLSEFGLTKKFYNRRNAFYIGADFGYEFATLEITDFDPITYNSRIRKDVKLSTFGGKAKAGYNFLFNKNTFFNLDLGYRFYGDLKDEDDNNFFEKEFEEQFGLNNGLDTDYLTPNGFFFKAGIGFTL